MQRHSLVAACIALIAGNAAAQSIVFQDGFESGFSQWSATGLWQAAQTTDACMAPVTPFPEGTGAAWYGITPACNFDTGVQPNFGTLLLNPWIQLPSGVTSISLYFQSRVLTEYCRSAYDTHDLQVIAQNGSDSGFTKRLCSGPSGGITIYGPPSGWHERRVDLSGYQGAQVRIAFLFNSVDGLLNNSLGWLVDDVRIVSEPGVTYCSGESLPSGCPCSLYHAFGGGCAQTGGASATLMSHGLASVAADSLSFVARHMPPGTTAVLMQAASPSAAPSPFGDGLLCLAGNLIRLAVVRVPSGTQTWPPAGAAPLSVLGGVPATGGNRYYQVFFRENGSFCTAGTFNLTSAQRIAWAP